MGKVHLLHLKFFAIQIGKNAGIGGKTKAKLVGIQRLMVIAVALVLGVGAVFGVTDQRMPVKRHVRTDLVGASGLEVHLQQAGFSIGAQGAVAGVRGPSPSG